MLVCVASVWKKRKESGKGGRVVTGGSVPASQAGRGKAELIYHGGQSQGPVTAACQQGSDPRWWQPRGQSEAGAPLLR